MWSVYRKSSKTWLTAPSSIATASRPSYCLNTTGLRKLTSSVKRSSIAEKSLDSAAARKRSLCMSRTLPVPLHRSRREQMRPQRPTQGPLPLRGSFDQLRQVHPGLDPHLLEHRGQVLGRDVPRGARRHRTTAELPEGALEGVDALLERGQHVRQALAAGVVEVRRQLDVAQTLSRRWEELADLPRVRHSGRVAKGDLLAAEPLELLGDLEDAPRLHLALVGAAEARRDHALASHPGIPCSGDRSLQIRQRLGDRAVDVLLVVCLRGREKEVRLLEAVAKLQCVVEALAIRDQHRVGDVIERLEPCEHLGAVGELGDHVGADE